MSAKNLPFITGGGIPLLMTRRREFFKTMSKIE
jgi:hypothetical protein